MYMTNENLTFQKRRHRGAPCSPCYQNNTHFSSWFNGEVVGDERTGFLLTPDPRFRMSLCPQIRSNTCFVSCYDFMCLVHGSYAKVFFKVNHPYDGVVP